MARPSRCRRICGEPVYDRFGPEGIPCPGSVVLALDEYEVIRLVDLEKLTHQQCAKQMDISRTTVTEIYEAAREKIADSIIHGKTLLISGGHYRVCDGSAACQCRRGCRKAEADSGPADDPGAAGREQSSTEQEREWNRPDRQTIRKKGAYTMKIAVTYENGTIFQHFGHTEQFKLYDVVDGKVQKEEVVDTSGSGHGALAGFLTDHKVDTLICGGIGGGAKDALAAVGIQLYGGVAGQADEAVKALLAGTLDYNPDTRCSHHDHEGHEHGQCGEHNHIHGQCGENHHGCHGN